MDKSEQFDSSIAQEERIIGITMIDERPQQSRNKIKFANVSQIKNFERLAQINNQKMMQLNPTLFSQNDINVPNNTHFISTKLDQYFMIGEKKQTAKDITTKNKNMLQINIDLTNIRRQSILKLQLSKIKKNRSLTVQKRETSGCNAKGFKYTFTMGENSLSIRVLVQLNGQYKVWKDMQVPLAQNHLILQFQEFNNEQTDLKVNDFLFHLALKMPYYRQTHYWFIHQEAVDIQKIQFRSIMEEKYFQDTETNCTNGCQLI